MHFTALISFLSLSVVVAALPADIPREFNLLARVDAVSDVVDPKRDHLEKQIYTAPSSSLVGQKVTKIYNTDGATVYAVADNYLVDFTWHKEFQESNNTPQDSKKIITYSEGTAITTGAETTVKAGIMAEYEGVTLEFGGETKTFTQAEKSTVKSVSTEITLVKNETTFYYQRRYNYRSNVWFLNDEPGKSGVISGTYVTDPNPADNFIGGNPSSPALNWNFTSQVLSETRAILLQPLQGDVPLENLKTYQPPAEYNLPTLTTKCSYADVEEGAQTAILRYIKALL